MHVECVEKQYGTADYLTVILEDGTMAQGRDRKRAQVSISLDRDVLARLERIADAEQRPLSGLLRVVISDWSDGRAPRIQVEAA